MNKIYLCKCHDEQAMSTHAAQKPQASLGTWHCRKTGKRCKVSAHKVHGNNN